MHSLDGRPPPAAVVHGGRDGAALSPCSRRRPIPPQWGRFALVKAPGAYSLPLMKEAAFSTQESPSLAASAPAAAGSSSTISQAVGDVQ